MAENKQGSLKMFLHIIYRALMVRKNRVFVAFLSIAIGAAIVTAMLSVYFDISIKMSRELRSYGANFFVGPGASSGSRTIDYSFFRESLEEIPGDKLIGASPYLYGHSRLDLGKAVIAGVRFSGIKKLSSFWQVEGKWIDVDFDDRHCMIGKVLAEKMELKTGDSITITNDEIGYQKEFIIRGIVETGDADDEHLFINIDEAQKILGMEGKINHAMFSIVSDGLDIDALSERIKNKSGLIDAKPIKKVSRSEGQILYKIKGLMALVAIIILAVTTLCVMTTLMAMVVERKREIGLMKALGAENKSIVFHFISETALIGIAGIIAGLISGFLLAQVLGQAVFSSSISLRSIVLPITLGISLTASLIAAAIPIRTAVKVEPAKVLKEE